MALRTLSGRHSDPRKGRGSGINPEGRFETTEREAYDDGWGQGDGEEAPALKTQIIEERASSIITRNQSPDIPFTQSINTVARTATRGPRMPIATCRRASISKRGFSPR
jgi:hypothetical protein